MCLCSWNKRNMKGSITSKFLRTSESKLIMVLSEWLKYNEESTWKRSGDRWFFRRDYWLSLYTARECIHTLPFHGCVLPCALGTSSVCTPSSGLTRFPRVLVPHATIAFIFTFDFTTLSSGPAAWSSILTWPLGWTIVCGNPTIWRSWLFKRVISAFMPASDVTGVLVQTPVVHHLLSCFWRCHRNDPPQLSQNISSPAGMSSSVGSSSIVCVNCLT